MNPSVVFADNISAYQKSRTRDCTACSQLHSCVVKIFCFAQEPQRISRGNPVCVIVLWIAVACDNTVAVIKNLVHLGYIVGVKNVVGVKYYITLIIFVGVFCLDNIEHPVECIALADLFFVKTFVYYCSGGTCDFGGIIRTVIGYNKYIDKLSRIILTAYACNQITDNAAFVSGGYNNCKAMLRRGFKLLRLFK